MPRDGLSQYAPPPGTNGITNYTIESTKYNGFVADVTQDLNLPRPIVAGGTGANNAHDAMIALSGEIAGQVVTNYDTFPFVSGSFTSDAGATSAPSVNGCDGICYVHATNTIWLFIEARDIVTGILYVRQKSAGTWGAWKQQAGSTADLDAAYVNVTGDTMSGPLIVPVKGNQIGIHGGTPQSGGVTTADANFLFYGSAGNWAGMGADAGGNVWLRAGLSGAPAPALSVLSGDQSVKLTSTINTTSPSTGALTVAGGLGVVGSIYTSGDFTTYRAGSPTTGYHFFGSAGGKYMGYDGTNFSFSGGGIIVQSGGLTVSGGPIVNAYSATVGYYYFGSSGTKHLNYDGTSFNFTGGPVIAGSMGSMFGSASANITAAGTMNLLFYNGGGGNWCGIGADGGGNIVFRTGNSGANPLPVAKFDTGQNCHFALGIYPGVSYTTAYNLRADTTTNYLQWDASTFFAYNRGDGSLYYFRANAILTQWRASDLALIHLGPAYKPGGGVWADSSDRRIKNELGEYTRGLDEITALRPVYYTYKGNETDTAPAAGKDSEGRETPVAVPYANSNHRGAAEAETKYTGLIAQEVEAIFPEMVTKRSAYIDGQPVDDLRDLDTTPLIFALINAVKELKAEVDALKAAR